MKAIIYAGIGLFSVATVYGLADYYSSQKKGTLDKLYAEEEIPVTPAVEEKTTIVMPVKNVEAAPAEIKTVSTKAASTKKAKTSARKKIKMEDFSRARIPEQVVEEKIKEEPVKKEEEIIPVKLTVEPVEKVVGKDDKERKISLEMYSRAPLKKHVKPVKKITPKD
jgi:hypothetical protein